MSERILHIRSAIDLIKANVAISITVIFCLGAAIFCSKLVFFGSSTRLATVKFGDGYSIRVWKETPALREADLDHQYPALYHDVVQDDRNIVSKTWLGPFNDDNKPYNIKTAFAENETLVAVYGSTNLQIFILFDVDSGESWPRLRDDEVEYRDGVREKWIDRYSRLRAENPTLPDYFDE